MDQLAIIDCATQFVSSSPLNFVHEEIALSKASIGMRIFDPPLLGFGAAGDELFQTLKEPGVIGEHFLSPIEWLPTAQSVISFFLPFTRQVKDSNQRDLSWPSMEWMHGRIEGQRFVNSMALHLQAELNSAGYCSMIPAIDPRFRVGAIQKTNGTESINKFTSNWSERHVAYICGLGTFSLSKGLITKAGIAGRFGSLITELELPATTREYSKFDAYCTQCGDCVTNCPANAISIAYGKNHAICSAFMDEILTRHTPYYGCGKCQVDVACEDSIP